MNLKLKEAVITKIKRNKHNAELGIKGGQQSKLFDNKKGAILWLKDKSKNDDIVIKYIGYEQD